MRKISAMTFNSRGAQQAVGNEGLVIRILTEIAALDIGSRGIENDVTINIIEAGDTYF